MREHVLCGRVFTGLAEMDRAFLDWTVLQRTGVHRTHGEVIRVRAAADHQALRPAPVTPYVVCERHLRAVGKDCLVSFAASLYSVPWKKVRRRMRVELRVTGTEVAIWSVGGEAERLCTHRRAQERGIWVVDQDHWKGLAEHHDAGPALSRPEVASDDLVTARSKKAHVAVGRRDLATYDQVGRIA